MSTDQESMGQESPEAELARCRALIERVAHSVNDLNNLLAAMRGHAQIAYENPDKQNVQELIHVVLTSTARAQKVIRDSAGIEGLASDVARTLHAATKSREAKILVVDDEQLVLSLMEGLLKQHGHSVTTAMSQEEALQRCRSIPFDLVFLDIRLGDQDGVVVFRKLRELLPAVPVIFLSGDPNIELIWRKCREEGADGFIKKPFDIREIENVVNRILALPG